MNNKSPKYAAIKNYIVQEIVTKNIAPGTKLFTEKELCDKFNVCRVTVQLALSDLQKSGDIYRIKGSGTFVGSPADIKNETIHHDVIHKFIPFIISNNSPSSRSLEMIAGAEDYLKTKSCYVTVHTAQGDFVAEQEIINSLVKNGIRAMIILPFHSDRNVQFYFKLVKRNIKIVFIDLLPNGIVANLVSSNNVLGGYLMTKHLIENGYRKIAVISGETKVATSYTERISGYNFAHLEAGLPVNNDYILTLKSPDDQMLRDEIPPAVTRLMSLSNPPDSIFCLNDLIAFNAYNALQKLGIKVPEDVGLTGFDNLSLSSKNLVQITTIDQHFHSIGYSAAKLCYESITSDFPGYTHLSLPVTLIERESSRPRKS